MPKHQCKPRQHGHLTKNEKDTFAAKLRWTLNNGKGELNVAICAGSMIPRHKISSTTSSSMRCCALSMEYLVVPFNIVLVSSCESHITLMQIQRLTCAPIFTIRSNTSCSLYSVHRQKFVENSSSGKMLRLETHIEQDMMRIAQHRTIIGTSTIDASPEEEEGDNFVPDHREFNKYLFFVHVIVTPRWPHVNKMIWCRCAIQIRTQIASAMRNAHK